MAAQAGPGQDGAAHRFRSLPSSRIVLVAITVVANLIGLSLVRTNYAWLLALGCGLLGLLPMIGPSAIYLPWIGYHIIMKNNG